MGLNRYRPFLLGLCLAAATAIACSDEGMTGSPTSPSSSGSSPGGAVISGRVNGITAAAPASGASAPMATSTLTISIVGTGISTTTDSAGRFTLTGVPAGTVQLALTGPGTSATITISGVEAGQRIDITVTIANGRARLDSENRSRGVDVEGRITEINAGARTLRVDGTLVSVPATATIRHGSRTLAFSNLAVGNHVEVKGNVEGTMLVATEVKVQQEDDDDDDGDDDGDEVEGAVSGLGGSCPNLAFTVQAVRVTTSAATRFQGSCNRVQNGRRVEVEGRRQADGSILAAKVEID